MDTFKTMNLPQCGRFQSYHLFFMVPRGLDLKSKLQLTLWQL